MTKVKKSTKKVVKKKIVLPNKMSALVGIALRDIRKAEKQRNKFVIDMGTYFDPNQELVCQVGETVVSSQKVCVLCAAGSVMAFSLGKANSTTELNPDAFMSNSNQLRAIDSLRQGSARYAAINLELPDTYDEFGSVSEKYSGMDSIIPEYSIQDPEPFHKAMEKFKAQLQKAGL